MQIKEIRKIARYDELLTCVIEIESIVNARPLCYLYDDGEGASYALMPSHFIYDRNPGAETFQCYHPTDTSK